MLKHWMKWGSFSFQLLPDLGKTLSRPIHTPPETNTPILATFDHETLSQELMDRALAELLKDDDIVSPATFIEVCKTFGVDQTRLLEEYKRCLNLRRQAMNAL